MFTRKNTHRLPTVEVAGARPRTVRRSMLLAGLAALGMAGGMAVTAPHAHASPGQCVQVGGFGGFCDGPMLSNGTFYHCENGMFIRNCFYVRPVSTDVDPRGWIPA
jgi:hypothetical protein